MLSPGTAGRWRVPIASETRVSRSSAAVTTRDTRSSPCQAADAGLARAPDPGGAHATPERHEPAAGHGTGRPGLRRTEPGGLEDGVQRPGRIAAEVFERPVVVGEQALIGGHTHEHPPACGDRFADDAAHEPDVVLDVLDHVEHQDTAELARRPGLGEHDAGGSKPPRVATGE